MNISLRALFVLSMVAAPALLAMEQPTTETTKYTNLIDWNAEHQLITAFVAAKKTTPDLTLTQFGNQHDCRLPITDVTIEEELKFRSLLHQTDPGQLDVTRDVEKDTEQTMVDFINNRKSKNFGASLNVAQKRHIIGIASYLHYTQLPNGAPAHEISASIHVAFSPFASALPGLTKSLISGAEQEAIRADHPGAFVAVPADNDRLYAVLANNNYQIFGQEWRPFHNTLESAPRIYNVFHRYFNSQMPAIPRSLSGDFMITHHPSQSAPSNNGPMNSADNHQSSVYSSQNHIEPVE